MTDAPPARLRHGAWRPLPARSGWGGGRLVVVCADAGDTRPEIAGLEPSELYTLHADAEAIYRARLPRLSVDVHVSTRSPTPQASS